MEKESSIQSILKYTETEFALQISSSQGVIPSDLALLSMESKAAERKVELASDVVSGSREKNNFVNMGF